MIYLYFGLGFILGVIITSVVSGIISTHGTLRIDHSNPNKDTYRFETKDLDVFEKKKRIILKIDNNADLSQK